MIDKLPYTLTKGVTATREGLVISPEADTSVIHALLLRDISQFQWSVMRWRRAAERLRYREGEHYVSGPSKVNFFDRWPKLVLISASDGMVYEQDRIFLHRLAAILCDDAEWFRVLYWCLNNLGGKS